MTFAVVVGRNGGLYFQKTSMGMRLCLWRIAFDVYYLEMEQIMRIANRCGLDGVELPEPKNSASKEGQNGK